MLKEEKERLKSIISDTITLLCRNSITNFEKDFSVEGLIGITVDSDDLVLVSIKEAVKNPNAPATPPPEQEQEAASGSDGEVSDSASTATSDNPNRKRKRRRRKRMNGDESPAKISRSQSDNDDDGDNDADNEQPPDYGPPLDAPGAEQYDANSTMNNTHGGDDIGHDDSSMYTLQEMRQNSDDDDLIEIIQEEPVRYGQQQQEHMMNMQMLNSSSSSLSSMPPGTPRMFPGSMPPGGNPLAMGAMGPGPVAPPLMGDLNEDVELMPGSGVYIKRAVYNQLQFIDKGSKLVRKLVREIFPDVNLLASSSCMGKGESSAGLDRHKVEVIKAYANAKLGCTASQFNRELSFVRSNLRTRLNRKQQKQS